MDNLAQRGVSDLALFRRPAEAEGSGQSNQNPQLTQGKLRGTLEAVRYPASPLSTLANSPGRDRKGE